MSKDVAIVSSLNEEVLEDLVSGRILAIRVTDFVPKNLCNDLSEYFLGHHDIKNYDHDVQINGQKKTLFYGVKRIGYPFNLTYGKSMDDPVKKEYYDRALAGTRELRELLKTNISPIDRLRLELDELWKDGANIARFENKMMLAGIGRVINHKDIKNNEPPHVDSIPPDISLDGRFSGIIYLKVPSDGGELELWDRQPDLTSEEKLNPEFNWRTRLDSPVVIRPDVGDLVLINTLLPHAVNSFSDGDRVAVQVFVGYKTGRPLQLWS